MTRQLPPGALSDPVSEPRSLVQRFCATELCRRSLNALSVLGRVVAERSKAASRANRRLGRKEIEAMSDVIQLVPQPLGRGRPTKFTPERMKQIRNLVERGKSRDEIAEIIGVTTGTLQVTCSKLGISLRRPTFDTGTGLLPRRRSGVSRLHHPNGVQGSGTINWHTFR